MSNKNAFLFIGDSFTWGQGLYFYSNLPNLHNPKSIYVFERSKITHAQIKFKNTLYYPRLVANHFKTFEIVKETNGGSEDETFEFFKNLFDKKKDIISSNLNLQFIYEDFEYLVLQLSAITRNKFYFNINGIEFNCLLNDKDTINYNLLEYMKANNYTFDDCYNQLLEQQFERLKKEVKNCQAPNCLGSTMRPRNRTQTGFYINLPCFKLPFNCMKLL